MSEKDSERPWQGKGQAGGLGFKHARGTCVQVWPDAHTPRGCSRSNRPNKSILFFFFCQLLLMVAVSKEGLKEGRGRGNLSVFPGPLPRVPDPQLCRESSVSALRF